MCIFVWVSAIGDGSGFGPREGLDVCGCFGGGVYVFFLSSCSLYEK